MWLFQWLILGNGSKWEGPVIAEKSLEHCVYLHGSWIVAHGGHRPDHLMQEREVVERTQLSIVGYKDKGSTSGVNKARERSTHKDCSHRVYPPWNGRGNILLTGCWPVVSMHHRMGAAPCWRRSRTHSLLRTRPPLLSAERGGGTEYKNIHIVQQSVSKEVIREVTGDCLRVIFSVFISIIITDRGMFKAVEALAAWV